MRCDRIVESGAYVLGALTPAERTTFEAHLSGCMLCRDEVADLAGVPGLLGRLDAAVAESLLGEGTHAQAGPEIAGSPGTSPPGPAGSPAAPAAGSADLHPPGPSGALPAHRPDEPPAGAEGLSPVDRLLAAVRRRRAVRRRWTLGLASAGAAAVLALGGVAVLGPEGLPPLASPGTSAGPSGTPTPRMMTMRPVGEPGEVSAQLGLTAFTGGTRINMHCEYGATDYDGRWTFRLYVYGRTGPAELAGTWTADPGADVQAAGTTRWAPEDITKVELRRGDNTPLLVYTP